MPATNLILQFPRRAGHEFVADAEDDASSQVLRRALCALTPLISGATDSTFLAAVIYQLTSIFGGTHGSVMLLDVPGDLSSALRVHAHSGLPDEALLGEVPRDGVAVGVLRDAQPTLILDGANGVGRLVVAGRGGVGAAMCVPIATADGVRFGVVSVSRQRGVHCRPFTRGDLEICDAIGMLVGDALERLRSRSAEAELRERIFAVERLSLMGEVAAGIAHEIASPITCVRINFAALVRHLKDLEPGTHPEADSELPLLLDDIRSGLERAEEVMRRMKALARLERAPRTNLDLPEVISHALALVRPRMRAALVVNVDDIQLCASEIDLTQLLVNIIINADDACSQRHASQGGAMQISIAAHVDVNFVFIDITDNGAGIASADLERIFQPLYTTKSTGTGLGLSLCRRLVQEQGGHLTVSSIVGSGTTFRIALPQK